MSKKFTITQDFSGYNTKRDSSKLIPGFLVSGSQNVLSTDGENIKIREGYTLDGDAKTGDFPIQSSYDWNTHSAVERNIRFFSEGTDQGKMQVRRVDGSTISWITVDDDLPSVAFNFAEYWDTTEGQDMLHMVNGESAIYSWSGGLTTVDIASSTANTLKKQGSDTWAEDRFITTGTDYAKNIVIDGVEFSYSGGEGTDTLTGVSPDPTAQGLSDGDVCVQVPSRLSNASITGLDTDYKNDLISVLNNQVWVGSFTDRQVFKSKINDFTDYTFSSPRIVGEGALITLDGVPVGFKVQEENMYVTAGKDQWYSMSFTLSADLVNETIVIQRLKTTAQEAAQSQALIEKIKNNIVHISNEPTLDELGRVENVDTPQSVPISDPIKTDFDALDFTNAQLKYYKNNLYLAIPAESRVYVYNIQRGFWEAPQLLPIRRLAIIGGLLYGHSSISNETYRLFDGTNDNGVSINAIAKFSYQNFGDRVNYKKFDEFYSEGMISTNTELTLTLNYDFEGFTDKKDFSICGSDKEITFQPTEDGSLGKNPLGKQPLGTTTDEIQVLSKFRQIDTTTDVDAFEIQVTYSSNKIDAQWELLGFGPNAKISTDQPIPIKK